MTAPKPSKSASLENKTLSLSWHISKSFYRIWLVDVSKSKFINTLSESKYIEVTEQKPIVWCFVKREYLFWVTRSTSNALLERVVNKSSISRLQQKFSLETTSITRSSKMLQAIDCYCLMTICFQLNISFSWRVCHMIVSILFMPQSLYSLPWDGCCLRRTDKWTVSLLTAFLSSCEGFSHFCTVGFSL